MPRVICKLPNASDEINGVQFIETSAGMLSEEISDDVATEFIAIPGYELTDEQPPEAPPEQPRPRARRG